MRAVDDLLATVEAGERVDCDGLRVDEREDGYAFAAGDASRDGLDADALREAAADHEAYVRNWRHWERVVEGPGTARRAFLRWLERADELPVPERYAALEGDGLVRSWGQLVVTAALDDDGERVYEVRHEDDVGTALDALDVHRDPLDARELVKTDAKGRYRPLKTAPTLPAGWAFPDLDGGELVRTVEFVYPATVANWHREREGDLDVTQFREAAERQSGIYDVVDELDVEGVRNLAAACCVDSQCLKRRQWDEDADTPLDVPRGEGEFPCREPCSLVISAARKFVTLESETPREYTFELTPSEKNQLEEILDAVAEGRIDEIREADLNDGANRYRARYLRAKRLTERGLDDVPTFQDDDSK